MNYKKDKQNSKTPRWFETLTPEPVTQLGLFPEALSNVLFRLRVSKDELSRWHEAGWISFPPDPVRGLEHHHVTELEFVTDVARSGLPDEVITQLLSLLPRPANFNPDLTVLSFRYGWMKVVAWKHFNSPFDEVDDRVFEWLQQHPDSKEKDIVESLWSDLRFHLGTLEELGLAFKKDEESDSSDGL